MSQAAFAAELARHGIRTNQQQIAYWEQWHSVPRPRTLVMLAAFLGVSTDRFMPPPRRLRTRKVA